MKITEIKTLLIYDHKYDQKTNLKIEEYTKDLKKPGYCFEGPIMRFWIKDNKDIWIVIGLIDQEFYDNQVDDMIKEKFHDESMDEYITSIMVEGVGEVSVEKYSPDVCLWKEDGDWGYDT